MQDGATADVAHVTDNYDPAPRLRRARVAALLLMLTSGAVSLLALHAAVMMMMRRLY